MYDNDYSEEERTRKVKNKISKILVKTYYDVKHSAKMC